MVKCADLDWMEGWLLNGVAEVVLDAKGHGRPSTFNDQCSHLAWDPTIRFSRATFPILSRYPSF